MSVNVEEYMTTLNAIKSGEVEWAQHLTSKCFFGVTVARVNPEMHLSYGTSYAAGRRILGLTEEQADFLFDQNRTIADSEAFIAPFLEGDEVKPEVVYDVRWTVGEEKHVIVREFWDEKEALSFKRGLVEGLTYAAPSWGVDSVRVVKVSTQVVEEELA